MFRVATIAILSLSTACSALAQFDELAGPSNRYPKALVDDVNRPGFNGRIYLRRPVIGGVDAWAVESGNPGADYFGAYGSENLAVGLVIDPLEPFSAFDYGIVSPWQIANDRSYRKNPTTNAFNRAYDKAADRLEAQRQVWLRENGMTGGVRTHVNDATLYAPTRREEASLPTPRATIQIPDGEPRLKRNLRVEGPARISLPPGVSAEIAAHVNRTGGMIDAPAAPVVRIAISD